MISYIEKIIRSIAPRTDRTRIFLFDCPSLGHRSAVAGISTIATAAAIAGQTAAAGFLCLPSALAATGWLGLPMMILFGLMVGFSATQLRSCWNILEERWPEEYSEPARQSYMEMAYRAFGDHGRRLALSCVLINLVGTTAAVLLFSGQMLSLSLPALSPGAWVLVLGAVTMPFSWLWSPTIFWGGTILVAGSSVIACSSIAFQVLFATQEIEDELETPSMQSVSVGVGFILFMLGGSSTYPIIQNKMANHRHFEKSLFWGFACILLVFLPLNVSAYKTFGFGVDLNILFTIQHFKMQPSAFFMQSCILIGSSTINFDVLSQTLEDALDLPVRFTEQKAVGRTVVVFVAVAIALAIPNYCLLMSLLGGSTMAVCSLVLPPLITLRLANTGSQNQKNELSCLVKKVLLVETALLGAVIAVLCTYSILTQTILQGATVSCFTYVIGGCSTESSLVAW